MNCATQWDMCTVHYNFNYTFGDFLSILKDFVNANIAQSLCKNCGREAIKRTGGPLKEDKQSENKSSWIDR